MSKGEFFMEFTWSFDTITEIYGEVIDDVQQEGEVINVVHVDVLWIWGNGPQLILISILHTYMSKTKKSIFASQFITLKISITYSMFEVVIEIVTECSFNAQEPRNCSK